MKLKKAGKDDKENPINAEKLLSFDPGNLGYMVGMGAGAHKAGYHDTALWSASLEANVGHPKA
jgi:hypothetical protein